jgi:hypothetical protein
MPPKDFVSITVKKEVYEHLRKQFKKTKKEWLLNHGITSFSGYVTYQLNELVVAQMKEDSEHHPNPEAKPASQGPDKPRQE